MTKQKLIGKIADGVILPATMEDMRHWQLRVAVKILALIKEALPELTKMDKIEEVKKILRQPVAIDEQVITDRIDRWDTHIGELHEDDVDRLAIQLCQLFEPKPDSGRLIDEHMMLLQTQNGGKVIVDTTPALKAQRDLTASIQDAEYQARMERIKREIEKCFFIDVHEPAGRRYIYDNVWQEFWKQEIK